MIPNAKEFERKLNELSDEDFKEIIDKVDYDSAIYALNNLRYYDYYAEYLHNYIQKLIEDFNDGLVYAQFYPYSVDEYLEYKPNFDKIVEYAITQEVKQNDNVVNIEYINDTIRVKFKH